MTSAAVDNVVDHSVHKVDRRCLPSTTSDNLSLLQGQNVPVVVELCSDEAVSGVQLALGVRVVYTRPHRTRAPGTTAGSVHEFPLRPGILRISGNSLCRTSCGQPQVQGILVVLSAINPDVMSGLPVIFKRKTKKIKIGKVDNLSIK